MRIALFLGMIFSAFAIADPKNACIAPAVNSQCCNYPLLDQVANQTVTYRSPASFFSSEMQAQGFAALQLARQTFSLPYNPADDLSIAGGWYYENGNHHSGSDFWRTNAAVGQDVSFQVKAAAAGKVVTAMWLDWFGNMVIIEHVSSSGQKYRTMYAHLRNNGYADWLKASKIVDPSPGQDTNWIRYIKFAAKGYNATYWGKKTQSLQVSVGQNVQEGQVIGWAGNTGAGGAGNGLNADGTPSDPARANNHLHFMLMVPGPGSSNDWVFVDAFGVYAKASSGCYEIHKQPGYARFFAPFPSSFFNLETSLLTNYFGYYPGMGLGLQTLSTYYNGSTNYSAGAFQYEVGSQWLGRVNMNRDAFNQWFKTYQTQGYRPRQLSATVVGTTPYFTAVWQKNDGNASALYFDMDDADFKAKWADIVVKQKYRIQDYAAYYVGSSVRYAAIYVKDGKANQFWRNMTAAEYQKKFNELYAQGLYPVSVHALDTASGPRFAGAWAKVPGTWAVYIDMTPAVFQQKFNEFAAQGMRFHKVVGYGNSQRFAAIWTK